jgi:hypothetical protein
MMENRQPLQQMLLGKVVICLQKTETRDYHPVLLSTQNGSRTLISDLKLSEASTEKSRELKSPCTTKEMASKLKKSSTEWEKIFTGYIHQTKD